MKTYYFIVDTEKHEDMVNILSVDGNEHCLFENLEFVANYCAMLDSIYPNRFEVCKTTPVEINP